MIIENGGNIAYKAEVTSHKRVRIEHSDSSYFATQNKESFILNLEVTPTGDPLVTPSDPSKENPSAYYDNNPFCYIKNTSDKDLVVTKTSVYLIADNIIILRKNPLGDPDTNSVTDITPVNLNFDGSDSATGDFYYGENITGLGESEEIGEGEIVKRWHINDDDGETDLTFDGNLILRTGDVLAYHIENPDSKVEMSVEFFYKNI